MESAMRGRDDAPRRMAQALGGRSRMAVTPLRC